jgi:hypothetical protein
MLRHVLTARRLWVVVGLLLVPVLGCGKPTVQYNYSVEGVVKLDGQPLGGVIIQFIPDDEAALGAIGSQAISGDDGHFKLVCDNQKTGAAIGKHHVIVTRGRPADPRHRGEKEQEPLSKDQRAVPAIYGIGPKTPLKTEVTSDKHTGYDFALNSSGS